MRVNGEGEAVWEERSKAKLRTGLDSTGIVQVKAESPTLQLQWNLWKMTRYGVRSATQLQ
jgi:hypothetical protein